MCKAYEAYEAHQAYEAYEAYEVRFDAAVAESGTLRSLILASWESLRDGERWGYDGVATPCPA